MGLSTGASSTIEADADEINGFTPVRWETVAEGLERRILSHLDRL